MQRRKRSVSDKERLEEFTLALLRMLKRQPSVVDTERTDQAPPGMKKTSSQRQEGNFAKIFNFSQHCSSQLEPRIKQMRSSSTSSVRYEGDDGNTIRGSCSPSGSFSYFNDRKLAILSHCLWSSHRNLTQGTTTTIRDLYYTDRGGGLLFCGKQGNAVDGVRMLESCLTAFDTGEGETAVGEAEHIGERAQHNNHFHGYPGSPGCWTRERLGFTATAKSVITGRGFSFKVRNTPVPSSSSPPSSSPSQQQEKCVSFRTICFQKGNSSSSSENIIQLFGLCTTIGTTCFDFQVINDTSCDDDDDKVITLHEPTFSHPSPSSSSLAQQPFLLIVEKEATLNHLLHNERILDHFEHILIVCGKGYPCSAASSFVQRFHAEMSASPWGGSVVPQGRMTPPSPPTTQRVKMLGMFDADPHGLSILSTYAFGMAALRKKSGIARRTKRRRRVVGTDIHASDSIEEEGEDCGKLRCSRLKERGDAATPSVCELIKRALPIELLLPAHSTTAATTHTASASPSSSSQFPCIPRSQYLPLTDKDIRRAEGLRKYWNVLLMQQPSLTTTSSSSREGSSGSALSQLTSSPMYIQHWMSVLNCMVPPALPTTVSSSAGTNSTSALGSTNGRKYELQALTVAFGGEYWTRKAIPAALAKSSMA